MQNFNLPKKLFVALVMLCCAFSSIAATKNITDTVATQKLDTLMPVRGFAIGVPRPAGVNDFIKFIKTELAPRKVNTLILRVDYAYQYKTHPELVDSIALSNKDAKKIVNACRQNNIRIVCQVNMLGHQSWANKTGKLLSVYPEFDETPQVIIPAKYAWPNADGLYCKSYCPLHPGVHKVLFDVVDELCDAFETTDFHAGMDEVFYIGEAQCPRCAGKDKAVLYAGEVSLISNHLKEKGRRLWIWGDRLLDGSTTGLGIWESSMNNTARAVDLIPKDIMVCDWHYDRPDQTPVYFAMKGLQVATCCWKNTTAAEMQVDDMIKFRERATGQMKDKYQGMIFTVWSGNEAFLKELSENKGEANSQASTFKALFVKINKL